MEFKIFSRINFHVMFYFLFFLLISFLTPKIILRENLKIDLLALAFNFSFSLFFTSLVLIFSKKKTITAIILIIIIVLGMLHASFYYNYNSLFNISSISLLKESQEVTNSIVDILFKSNAVYFVFYLTFVLLFAINDFKNSFENKKIGKKILKISIFLYFLIWTAVFIFMNPKQNFLKYKNLIYNFNNMTDRQTVMKSFGFYNYPISDVFYFLNSRTKTPSQDDISRLDIFFNNWIKENKQEKNEFSGILKNDNLIMIQAEALIDEGIDKELTPNLWKMKNNSVYFQNHNSIAYLGNTSDAEFASQTGLMPHLQKVTSYDLSQNTYVNTLPKMFKNQKYKTTAMHCNDPNFYNRRVTYDKVYEFDQFYSTENLKLEKKYIPWNMDSECFDSYLENIDTNSNFYSFIVSISTHGPYKNSYEQFAKNKDIVKKTKNIKDDEYLNYLSTTIELDKALGVLNNWLKKENILDKTTIIIYGDHESAMSLVSKKTTLEKEQVPLIISSSKIASMKKNKKTNHYDILPTIANLFNLKYKKEYVLGSDVFSKKESPFINASSQVDHKKPNKKQQEMINAFQEILDTNYLSLK